MKTLSITLPSDLAEMIEEKVASGTYHSASDIVRVGLALFQEHELIHAYRLESLRKELAVAEQQIENGEVIPFTSAKEYAEKIMAEGRKIMASRGKK